VPQERDDEGVTARKSGKGQGVEARGASAGMAELHPKPHKLCPVSRIPHRRAKQVRELFARLTGAETVRLSLQSISNFTRGVLGPSSKRNWDPPVDAAPQVTGAPARRAGRFLTRTGFLRCLEFRPFYVTQNLITSFRR